MKIIGHEKILSYLGEGTRRARLNPSLIFSGPDGIGKKQVALQLAAFFCCEKKPTAVFDRDCDCAACRRVPAGNHPDVLLVNRPLQAALLKEKPESQTAIKIESIRHIDKFLHLKPNEGTRRVCIVEEADKLTDEAANSFLKLLEEPPHSSLIILLALSEKNMISTILSRCAVLRFRPVSSALIARWLEETQGLGTAEAKRAAELSQGSFSKAVQYTGEKETLDLAESSVDEFFAWLGESGWRKEGRQRAEKVLNTLIETAREKMAQGDLSQQEKIRTLLTARRQLDRHVPARLVLENVFVKLEPVFK